MKTVNYRFEVALEYAKLHDFRIIPIGPTKIPLIADWPNQASSQPEVITKWFERFPNANLSCVTGSLSRIVVLDVDVKNGAKGLDSLQLLIAEHGALPVTSVASTPSGGLHYFFNYDGGLLPRRIGFRPGLDFLSEKSHVLLAPSVDSAGNRYAWFLKKRIQDLEFAPLPEWLRKIVLNEMPTATENSTCWKRIAKEGCDSGSRNTTLAKLTGHLLRKNIDAVVTLELLQAWNAHRNRPPLPELEVRNVVESIAGIELKRRMSFRGIQNGK